MSLQRVSVSVPLEAPSIEAAVVITLFHDWIRRGAVEGLLIDVTSYSHVHHGPGVMLIGHEGDYSVDLAGGRPSLRYTLKRTDTDTPQGAVALAARRLAGAAEAAASAGIRVIDGDVTVQVFDRLRAPNTDQTAQVLTPQIAAGVRDVTGWSSQRAERLSDDPRSPFGLRLVAPKG